MGASSLSSFLSVVRKRGIARDNRFVVLMPPVRGFSNLTSNPLIQIVGPQVAAMTGGNSALGGLALVPFKAELPGRSILLRDRNEMPEGMRTDVADIHAITDLQLSFYCGSDMFEYFFMHQWMEDIRDTNTSTLNFMQEYAVDFIVATLDDTNNVVSAVVFEQAFPFLVNPIPLDMESKNMYMRVDVTFRYRRWRMVPTLFSLSGTVLSVLNKKASGIGNVVGGLINSVSGGLSNKI